jgi:hypothetical protein
VLALADPDLRVANANRPRCRRGSGHSAALLCRGRGARRTSSRGARGRAGSVARRPRAGPLPAGRRRPPSSTSRPMR